MVEAESALELVAARLLTPQSSPHHHRDVPVIARVVAATLVGVLSVSPVALCAGWQATPEARMACCVEGMACSMHTPEDESTGTRTVSQAEADSCCAAGEQNDASPTAKPLTAVSAVAIATQSTLLPPQTAVHAWSQPVTVPNHGHAVSRHLLLSVFIV